MRSAAGLLAAVALSVLAATAQAQLSPKYADFAKGPVQFLMTGEDQKAWRQVKTDAEAQDFIDLFWARRDPTPGTPRNEFRDTFEERVKAADKLFAIPNSKKRGALTDMGRVLILLGPPANLGTEIGQAFNDPSAMIGMITGQQGQLGAGSFAGGSQNYATNASDLAVSHLSDKKTWEYANFRQLGLSGPVVFIEKTGYYDYFFDPKQSQVSGALLTAVQKAIVNRDLKQVPDWARKKEIELGTARVIEAAPVVKETVVETKTVTVPVAAPPPAPVPQFTGVPGMRRFTLIKDVGKVLDPQVAPDPLVAVSAASTFSVQGDLGYVYEYCAANLGAAPLRMAISISGLVGNEKLNMHAPPEDVTPEPIKSKHGCAIVRGSIPLSDLKPGKYTFSITVEDPSIKQSYNARQEFKVE